jgi:uncharacterized protein (DUF3820 family)
MSNTVMPSGKFAGTPISDLESTYIVYSLEKNSPIGALKEAMLKELHKRFFEAKGSSCIILNK